MCISSIFSYLTIILLRAFLQFEGNLVKSVGWSCITIESDLINHYKQVYIGIQPRISINILINGIWYKLLMFCQYRYLSAWLLISDPYSANCVILMTCSCSFFVAFLNIETTSPKGETCAGWESLPHNMDCGTMVGQYRNLKRLVLSVGL